MRRFWSDTKVDPVENGWQVTLDGRPVRTPAKRACVLPIEEMARNVAAEWESQLETVDPMAMPLTRAASTCLDRVAPERAAVAENVASYGRSDLICYRAPHPPELAARQTSAWDPWLDWAERDLNAPLRSVAGVMHVEQDQRSLYGLAKAVHSCGPWTLTALSELVTISGSLVLGLAVQRGALAAGDAWPLSRLEEDWNVEEWGEDADAAEQAARRKQDFLNAATLIQMLPDPSY